MTESSENKELRQAAAEHAAETSKETSPAQAEKTAAEEKKAETMEDFKEELEASFRKISEGDIITATVIAVSEEEATLDLKYYAPGIIKASDLSDDPDYSILQELHPGDEIQATVLRLDDGDGNILLSKKEANQMLGWEKLKEAMNSETILTVRVKEAVNAGVITYAEGLRGFIPASQLSLDYVEDTSSFIGKDLEVRVINVDAAKEKLVLSAKAVLKEREEDARRHRISMLVPGTVVEGTVESLTNYGAFVNIGDGLTGLVHVSQICERRIRKPSEVLKVGQTVRAKIRNTDDNRISLSIRALEEEMSQTVPDESAEAAEYSSGESASTSLGDLIAKLNLH